MFNKCHENFSKMLLSIFNKLLSVSFHQFCLFCFELRQINDITTARDFIFLPITIQYLEWRVQNLSEVEFQQDEAHHNQSFSVHQFWIQEFRVNEMEWPVKFYNPQLNKLIRFQNVLIGLQTTKFSCQIITSPIISFGIKEEGG